VCVGVGVCVCVWVGVFVGGCVEGGGGGGRAYICTYAYDVQNPSNNFLVRISLTLMLMLEKIK